MKKLFVILTLIILISCKKEAADIVPGAKQSASPSSAVAAPALNATPALYFDSLFTRYGGGWTGGDVAYSYRLPDGRSLWLWGDTFLDTVYPDRHRPVVPFIHNSIVLTDSLGGFTTLYGGTEKDPVAYFNARDPYEFWPNCAFMNKSRSKIYVMMATIKISGSGIFGFELVGNSVGVLNAADFSIQKIFKFSKGSLVDWSAGTLEDGDYVYLYGTESTTYTKFMHVCRTSIRRPFEKIEYYDGANWTTDASRSARLKGAVSEQYSVFKYNGKYYLLSQEGILLSPDIYLWDAAGPVGPFTRERKVYTTPQTDGNIITYNATAHTEFIQNGQLLVGYCVNSLNGVDLYRNADNYRPYFVWVNDWQ